jgi:hypothetical protein
VINDIFGLCISTYLSDLDVRSFPYLLGLLDRVGSSSCVFSTSLLPVRSGCPDSIYRFRPCCPLSHRQLTIDNHFLLSVVEHLVFIQFDSEVLLFFIALFWDRDQTASITIKMRTHVFKVPVLLLQ